MDGSAFAWTALDEHVASHDLQPFLYAEQTEAAAYRPFERVRGKAPALIRNDQVDPPVLRPQHDGGPVRPGMLDDIDIPMPMTLLTCQSHRAYSKLLRAQKREMPLALP